MTHPNLSVTLPLPEPFGTDLILRHLRKASFGTPYVVSEDDSVYRVMRLNGESALIRLDFSTNHGASKSLSASIRSSFGKNAWKLACQELRDRLAHVFGVHHPLEDCHRQLGNDPVLGAIVQRLKGLRLVQGDRLYETLFIIILGQQVSVSSAQAQRKKLLQTLGQEFCSKNKFVWSIPAPEVLADVTTEKFRDLGISRQKARYLRVLAMWAADGKLRNSELQSLNDDAAIDHLKGIPGVGHWSAQIALARGLSRLDIFPAADIGLQNTVQRLYQFKRRPDETELSDFAERWQGWRSYASLYLWSVDL